MTWQIDPLRGIGHSQMKYSQINAMGEKKRYCPISAQGRFADVTSEQNKPSDSPKRI